MRASVLGLLLTLAWLASFGQDDQANLVNRAVRHLSAGRFADALAILDPLVKEDTTDITLRHNRAIACFNLKKYRQALADYLFLIRENPLPEYLFQAGNSYEHLNKPDSAIAYYTRTLEVEKDNFLYFFKRGTVLLKTSKYSAAILDFNEALLLNPEHSNSMHNRGLAKFATGNNRGACEDWCDASILGNATAALHLSKNCKTYPPRCRQ